MLDQATMKLSVQIPKSENPDNREPWEIADITNCYPDHDIAQVVEAYAAMEEEPKPVTYWGSGTEHDPLCYKTRHCLTYFDQFIYIHHNAGYKIHGEIAVKFRQEITQKRSTCH